MTILPVAIFFIFNLSIGHLINPISIGGFKSSSLISLLNNYKASKIINGITSGTNFFDDLTIHRTNNSNLMTPTVDQAKHYMYYAAAAFCSEQALGKWNCEDCLAVGSEVKLFKQINNRTTNNRAFLAIDHENEEIILAYRGATNLRSVMQTNAVDLIKIPGGNGKIRVHRGAWTDVMSLNSHVANSIRYLHSKFPNYGVVIVGHSLGGMLASLALFKLKTTLEFSNISYSLYTYGQPRTGNLDYALWMNSQRIPAIRVVANGDVISHITQSSAGYVHHSRELWVTTDGYRFCSDEMLEDPTCSNSIGPYYSILAHLVYFNSNIPPTDCVLRHPLNYIRRAI